MEGAGGEMFHNFINDSLIEYYVHEIEALL